MTRLLLLEDDSDLGPIVARGLRQDRHAVDLVTDLAAARHACAVHRYDVAVVDLGLPDGDGLDLLDAWSQDESHRPRRVLVLTARDAVEDRINGLDAGADDYLTKPFALGELQARIRALARRGDRTRPELAAAGIRLDEATLEVTRDGRPIDLTPREFAICRVLLEQPGAVVSAEQLLERVWDDNANPFTASPRVLMSRLRRKLGPPGVIETVRSAGYRIVDPKTQ